MRLEDYLYMQGIEGYTTEELNEIFAWGSYARDSEPHAKVKAKGTIALVDPQIIGTVDAPKTCIIRCAGEYFTTKEDGKKVDAMKVTASSVYLKCERVIKDLGFHYMPDSCIECFRSCIRQGNDGTLHRVVPKAKKKRSK